MFRSGFISIECKVSVLRGVSVLIATPQNGQQASPVTGLPEHRGPRFTAPGHGYGNREPVARRRALSLNPPADFGRSFPV
jgi:hypothetical protein